MRTLILTAAFFASSVWADTAVKANVPFAYDVTGVEAANGDCRISINGGQVTFASPSGRFARPARRDTRATSGVRLVFRRYGANAVLTAIELGTSGSVQFMTSPKEKEWMNLGLTARIEMVPVVRTAD